MSGVVILSAARTPYGRALGSLAEVSAASLGGFALSAAIERSGIGPDEVDRIILGNVFASALRGNPAAAASKEARLAPSIPAFTVRAGCASGLIATATALDSIVAGRSRVALAGGFESSSSAPHVALGLRKGLRLGGGTLLDVARHDGPAPPLASGERAAFRGGRPPAPGPGEIVAVDLPAAKRGAPSRIDLDDAQRDVQEGVEASHASPAPILADGAAAVVLASETWARERGLKALARVSPAPSKATTADLAGFRYLHTDLPDPEASALAEAVSGGSTEMVKAGGSSGIPGHAPGADGARLLVTLLHLLMQTGGGRGLALAAGGWGESAGVIVEV